MRLTVGFLEFNGVELGNDQRVLTYLRRKLGDPGWQVPLNATLVGGSDAGCGYVDEMEEDYEGYCAFPPIDLSCFCDATAEDGYITPDQDPAPWYEPERPESVEFLGFQPVTLTIDPALTRSVAALSRGGAVIGRPRPPHRVLAVSGFLHASTLEGLAWGERWMTQILRGTESGCSPDTARILPACPSDTVEEDWPSYFRTLRSVGVIDGPVFGSVDGSRALPIETVSFQIAAGSEWLYAPEEQLRALSSFVTGDVVHVLMEGPASIGQTAAVIRIYGGAIGTAVTGIDVTVRPTSADVCPSAEAVTHSFTIDYVPRDGYIEIDSAQRTLRVFDEAGDVVGSFDKLTFTDLWDWIIVGPGEQVCIRVDATTANTNTGTLLEVVSVDIDL